jgi:hypothetical protein
MEGDGIESQWQQQSVLLEEKEKEKNNKKRRFPQLVKQLSAFYGPEDSLPFSEQPTFSPYPELVDSRAHIPIVFKIRFNIIVPSATPLCLGFASTTSLPSVQYAPC